MPRPPRENVEDGIYHVFSRGNAHVDIFRDDIDRHIYLRKLSAVSTRLGWRCLAYCLMTNHVHLLLETPKPNLSAGMHRLHGGYALAFNARHDRHGHLFQGRYGAVRMETSEQVCVVAAYIARNPLEASMCSRPEHYLWSSYRATIDRDGPDWLDYERLLPHFSADPDDARSIYARMAAAP